MHTVREPLEPTSLEPATALGKPPPAQPLPFVGGVAAAERSLVAVAQRCRDEGWTVLECLGEVARAYAALPLSGRPEPFEVAARVVELFETSGTDTCVDPLTGCFTQAWLLAALPVVYRRLVRRPGGARPYFLAVALSRTHGIAEVLRWQVLAARILTDRLPDAECIAILERGTLVALVDAPVPAVACAAVASELTSSSIPGSVIHIPLPPTAQEAAATLVALPFGTGLHGTEPGTGAPESGSTRPGPTSPPPRGQR
jgi:hypothetical protein